MPNVVTEMIEREYASTLADSDAMVLVSMHGLSVSETESLRCGLAEQGVQLRVLRNRLAKRVMADKGVALDPEVFKGCVAIAWGSAEDAIQAAKVIHGAPIRKEGKIAFRAGLLEGEILGPDETSGLASIPGRDELRAMILGCLSGPARGLVGVIDACPSSIARVLQARVDAGGGVDEPEVAAEEPATEATEGSAEETPTEEAVDEAPAEEASAEEGEEGEEAVDEAPADEASADEASADEASAEEASAEAAEVGEETKKTSAEPDTSIAEDSPAEEETETD